MSDVAASGGYYIAMPANAIVAEPATLTGSIGVVMLKFVIDGTLKKLGMNMEGVNNGRYADLYSPVRAFSPEERAKVQEQMQATYDTFVEKAAAGRNTTPERIDSIAQGRVWTGAQAKADRAGGRARRARARARGRQAAREAPARQRSRDGRVSRKEVVLRHREEPIRRIGTRQRARRAARHPRSASAAVARRSASGLSPRRAARNHAERICSMNR